MLFRLALVLSSASLAVIVACGSSGSGNKTGPDAAGTHAPDASGTHAPDAAQGGGLTGLGQKCGSGEPACPSNASECVGVSQGGPTYCTPTCLTGGVGTTDGSGNFTGSGSGALTPAPSDAMCAAAYTGGAAGVAACDLIATFTPMDNPIKANTKYTAVSFACSVNCGGTMAAPTCPTGMTCQTGALAGLCLPN